MTPQFGLVANEEYSEKDTEALEGQLDSELKRLQEEGKISNDSSGMIESMKEKLKKKLEELNPLGNLNADNINKALVKKTEGTFLGNIFKDYPKVPDFLSQIVASKEARSSLMKIPFHPSKMTRYFIGFIGILIFFWWVGKIISKSIKGFFASLGFWFVWKVIQLGSIIYWFGMVFSEELAPSIKIFKNIFFP